MTDYIEPCLCRINQWNRLWLLGLLEIAIIFIDYINFNLRSDWWEVKGLLFLKP